MLIQVADLQLQIKKRLILDSISFTIEHQNALWIIGHNGSGKTMLLKALAGLMPSTEPFIERVPELQLGLFLNKPSLYPNLTIRQNLHLHSVIWNQDSTPAEDFLNRVNLDPSHPLEVRKLSLGMQQKVGLAVSLIPRPNLLLWDEPFNGIDQDSQGQIVAYLTEQRAKHGVAFVLTSHLQCEPILTDMQVLELVEGKMKMPAPTAL